MKKKTKTYSRRERFKRALDATGMTDLAIARWLGIPSSNITRFKQAIHTPKLYHAALLLAAFGDALVLEDFLADDEIRRVERLRGRFTSKRAVREAIAKSSVKRALSRRRLDKRPAA